MPRWRIIVAQQLPQKLDAIQFHALWQQLPRGEREAAGCRRKRRRSEPITILGRGTGVVGGTIKTKIKRADIEQILLDGFLPVVSMDDVPEAPPRR